MNTRTKFIAGTILMLLASCAKEAAQEPSVADNGTTKQDLPKVVDTWHDNGAHPGIEGVDYGCWGDPVDCLEPIVVTPTSNPAITAVFNAIASGNAAAICMAFSMNEQTLLSVGVSKTSTTAVINQSSIAQSRISGSTRYLIIRSAAGGQQISAVHPMQ